MKKNYVIPAIKAANIVVNQIIMTSGSKQDVNLDVDTKNIYEYGYAD